MAQKLTDHYLWEALTKMVTPLSEKERKTLKSSYKLSAKVRTPIIQTKVLDLHGFTVQEAFEALEEFLRQQTKAQTKQVEVITGKGRFSRGLIRSEIFKWIDNPKIGKYIKEMIPRPDGGAVSILLKKTCKKGKNEVP